MEIMRVCSTAPITAVIMSVYYGLQTFLGNVLFLQTILVPHFGSNGPLWSLANEFWYYVIFPLCFFAIRSKSALIWRLLCAAIALILCCVLPFNLVLYGIVWLLGFCIVLIETHISIRSIGFRGLTLASIVLFVATLYSPRYLMPNQRAIDFTVAIAFSVLLFFLVKMDIRSRMLNRVFEILSGFSYTLYLTHYPFLALLSCAVFANKKIQLSLTALPIFLAFYCAAIFYAFCVYLIFEKNTKRLQTALNMERIGTQPE